MSTNYFTDIVSLSFQTDAFAKDRTLAAVSVASGLDKGIKLLSNINLGLAAVLAVGDRPDDEHLRALADLDPAQARTGTARWWRLAGAQGRFGGQLGSDHREPACSLADGGAGQVADPGDPVRGGQRSGVLRGGQPGGTADADVHRLAAVERRVQRGAVGGVTGRDLDVRPEEGLGPVGLAGQRPHVETVAVQARCGGPAEQPGRAEDEDSGHDACQRGVEGAMDWAASDADVVES